MRPTMVAGDFAFGLVIGNGEADFKFAVNARSASHPDENRMKIGAIAALVVASPDDIAAAPAFAAFVVSHHADGLFINRSHLLIETAALHGIFRQGGNRPVQR